jgi:RNA polymerase sigma factor (sigma-70 family)
LTGGKYFGVTGGDAQGRFNEVVLAHLDDSYCLARWMTGNPADAEDVVQDACLRATRGIGGFSGGNSRAWMLAIVRNTALTWLKKNRPKAMVFTDDMEAAERMSCEPPSQETPESLLIARADAARVAGAVAGLPEFLRETFVLREIQDLSYREIAEVTGAPVGTVMSRLSRARWILVQTLGTSE